MLLKGTSEGTPGGGWMMYFDIILSITQASLTFKVKLSPKCNLGFFVNVYESNLRVKA